MHCLVMCNDYPSFDHFEILFDLVTIATIFHYTDYRNDYCYFFDLDGCLLNHGCPVVKVHWTYSCLQGHVNYFYESYYFLDALVTYLICLFFDKLALFDSHFLSQRTCFYHQIGQLSP